MQSSTPFPMLRTYLSVVHRKLRFVLLNVLNLVSIALAIIGFSAQNLAVEIISITGLLVGVVGVAVTTWTWYRAIEDLRVQDLPLLSLHQVKSLEIPPRLLDSDYEILLRRGAPSDALLTSRRINRTLFSGTSSELKIRKANFRVTLPTPISYVLLRKFTQQKSIVLFNGKKIRLATEPMFHNGSSLMATEIQPTRYFDTMVTNDSLFRRVMSRQAQSAVFTGNGFCFPDHMIPACEQSACANQVGASTIAVTSDDYLVIVEQGRRSNVAESKLASSGSGSADWKDVGDLTDLQQLVKRFAERELVEECGLPSDGVAWLGIIGYGRLLRRGGLPQFFCLAGLKYPRDKIHVTRSERGLTDNYRFIDIHAGKHSRYDGIQSALRDLRREDYRVGSSLWWNLELLSQIPEDDIENAFR
jgi:hypothetical protein